MDIIIIKESLTKNLCSNLSSCIVDGFTSIYEDAVRANSGNIKSQMKRFLKDIPDWPDEIIERETIRILECFPSLRKVLKTLMFINVKSLTLMNKHDIDVTDQYISSNTPNVKQFVHQIYKEACKEFFHDDKLIDSSVSGTRLRQFKVVEDCIIRVLYNHIPLNDLLSKISDDDEFSQTKATIKKEPEITKKEEQEIPQREQEQEEEEEQEEVNVLFDDASLSLFNSNSNKYSQNSERITRNSKKR